MSIWIRTVCRSSVAGTTPDELLRGIGKRLMLLTYSYGEDDYEETLARLRVESDAGGAGFDVFRIYYRPEDTRFLRVERWSRPKILDEVDELAAALGQRDGRNVAVVRDLLANAVEIVGFELKLSDANGMGWPVGMAAAAYIAEKGAGAIYAEGEGWLEPVEGETGILLGE